MVNDREVTYTILISSSLDKALNVLFEPAGGEWPLAAGKHFRVTVTGPEDEAIEISHEEDSVAVWPSPRHKLVVYTDEGQKLDILGY